MSTLIKVLKNLLNANAVLSRLEVEILGTIQRSLTPESAELWAKQISAINRIHRSPDGKEVNFFAMQNGKAKFPPDVCYKRTEEFKVAVVDITAKAVNFNCEHVCGALKVMCFQLNIKLPSESSSKHHAENGR